jgi:hypothetical protein
MICKIIIDNAATFGGEGAVAECVILIKVALQQRGLVQRGEGGHIVEVDPPYLQFDV